MRYGMAPMRLSKSTISHTYKEVLFFKQAAVMNICSVICLFGLTISTFIQSQIVAICKLFIFIYI